MAVMAVWAVWAVLVTYGVSTGIAMKNLGLKMVTPLDMAENSVDDMYVGCEKETKSMMEAGYLEYEINTNNDFKKAWDKAEEYYNEKWQKQGSTLRKALVKALNLFIPCINLKCKEQIMAAHTYTLEEPKIYYDFNNAVRTQRFEYKTTFKYHALHFFLTDAIKTLNTLTPEKNRCVTGFRGVNRYFSQNVLNTEIRFGSFTSATMAGLDVAKTFGDKSCFKIVTCFGADISKYSKYEGEAEVLIPPYEVFKVTQIERKSEQTCLECEVMYTLKSTRTLSNLNCALVPKPHMSYIK